MLKKKNKEITTLYEHYKNTPKKLKIICDWDEVIQACESYASFKTIEDKKEIELGFEHYFEWFWETKGIVKYSFCGSVLNPTMFLNYPLEKQIQIKNSQVFYQEAPFLTIAEDLLKLIKEDKVEQIIFLVYCEVLSENEIDNRIELIFKKTFGKFPNCSLQKIRYIVEDGDNGGVELQYQKSVWIEKFASDFDLVIDDNPIICGNIVHMADIWKKGVVVIAPYYPALTEQHSQLVLLVKQEVSDLEKGDFSK